MEGSKMLYCAKCGKQIKALESMMYEAGLPYHSRCGQDFVENVPKDEPKNFGVGKYQTRCGFKAVVAQVKCEAAMRWSLKGAIECPTTHVLQVCEWDLMGCLRSDVITHGQFDLVKSLEEC